MEGKGVEIIRVYSTAVIIQRQKWITMTVSITIIWSIRRSTCWWLFIENINIQWRSIYCIHRLNIFTYSIFNLFFDNWNIFNMTLLSSCRIIKIFGCDGVEGDLSDCIASKKSSGIFLLVINWFKPYEWTTFFWFNFLFIGDIIGNNKLFCDLLSM